MNKLSFFSLVLCFSPIVLHAQIGTGNCDALTLGDASSATIPNFSVVYGTNRVVVVNGIASNATMPSDISISYNGQNFTSYYFSDGAFAQYLTLGTGGNITSDLTINVNIGTAPVLSIQAISFSGVEQSAPITDMDVQSGTGTFFSATVNSQVDDLMAVFAGYTVLWPSPPGVILGAGQTEICTEGFTFTSSIVGGGTLSVRSSISTKPGASPTVTGSFTGSSPAFYKAGAILALNMQYDGTSVFGPNTFTGGNGTMWNDPANWSYGVLPAIGHDVLVPAGQNVVVPTSITGLGSTIEVETGANLEIQSAGELDIHN